MPEMESEIGFAQFGLGSVLKQYNLAVPPNQREYSWTEKEVGALFQDLDKEITTKVQSYFLGTLVTIPRNLGHLEVVDGQQRLATAAILLSAIRNHLQEIEQEMARSIETDFLYAFNRDTRDYVPKLRLNVDDNDYFIRRLVKPDQPLESTRPSHDLLAEAFSKAECQVEKIVAGLDPEDHGDALNRWVSYLEYQATVILLRVPNSSNAYRMFETLNDRGIKVSQSDLVKNYLFGEAGDRFDEVQQRWAYMRGALESMEDEDTTITFLRHSLTIMYEFVREADVYDLVASRVSGSLNAVRFSGQLETLANTTEQLPLHRRHKTRAGGVVIPQDTLHSSHGPGSQKGGEEPQTAGKTTAGQRARPVHQMPARTRQAKPGLLRAVLQKDPRTPSREKADAKRAQSAGE